MTELPDTWPNGVPYIDEDTRSENFNSPEALRDLIATLWLYIDFYHERQLTTEQKELLADVVERHERDFDMTYDRWWQR
jgi:hypothetical protein